ncbi:Phosphorylated carbohydrates phosphatase [Corynebacterium kalinowskii]|uniref:Phosphorylated carbohydrates phosphatase n=1 Tax=Corynebacterium kalinowskii TaxID=2675216 RepID=A0A6B8VGA0_9CORY|nr:HAD family phosphatase [Corynebacterium kalinowskii]QGU02019.1 Phosphorylated carbohydrates phosphatase [Corynebacterium kalinowskii]
MYNAVLWDMDGTLVDSEPLWEIATYELSESLGRRITPEFRARTIGGTFQNTLQLCADFAGVSVSAEQAEQLQRQMFTRMHELLSTRLELRPGIEKLLSELANSGTPMMLVTNTARELADPAIEAIGRDFFTSTICGDEVANGKPNPEIYRTAALRLGFQPDQCLAFEDSPTGMASATAAGCRVVGLPERGEVPAEALDMRDLHGSTSFLGVTAADLAAWYAAFDN